MHYPEIILLRHQRIGEQEQKIQIFIMVHPSTEHRSHLFIFLFEFIQQRF